MGKQVKASDVRQALLDVAPDLIATADKLARGKLKDYDGNIAPLQAMLRLVSPVIALDDDIVIVDSKPEYTLAERIATITDAMMSGSITLP